MDFDTYFQDYAKEQGYDPEEVSGFLSSVKKPKEEETSYTDTAMSEFSSEPTPIASESTVEPIAPEPAKPEMMATPGMYDDLNAEKQAESSAMLEAMASRTGDLVDQSQEMQQEAMQPEMPIAPQQTTSEDIQTTQQDMPQAAPMPNQMASQEPSQEQIEVMQAMQDRISQEPGQSEAEAPSEPLPMGEQSGILGKKAPITQKFGNRSSVEKYSGGVNYGVDIAVPRGTTLAAPPGRWKAVEVFGDAKVEGPNNKQGGINRGYGNSVLLENMETGEKMRFSHLQVGGVGVKPGQEITGGTIFGKTGASGNTAGRTGQHLDWEYYDSNGKIRDGLKTKYANYLFAE